MFSARNGSIMAGRTPAWDSTGPGAISSSSPASLGQVHSNIKGNLIVFGVGSFAQQPATATVGSTPMNSLGTLQDGNQSGTGGIQLFYLLNSGLTGSQTITASWATHPTYAIVCSVSYKNVNRITTTWQTNTAVSTAVSLVPSPALTARQLMVAVLGYYNIGSGTFANTGAGTQRYTNKEGGTFSMSLRDNYGQGTGDTGSGGSSGYWSIGGIVLS
jgi:hypothetical protein